MTNTKDTTDHTACTAIIQATAKAGAEEIHALLAEIERLKISVHEHDPQSCGLCPS